MATVSASVFGPPANTDAKSLVVMCRLAVPVKLTVGMYFSPSKAALMSSSVPVNVM